MTSEGYFGEWGLYGFDFCCFCIKYFWIFLLKRLKIFFSRAGRCGFLHYYYIGVIKAEFCSKLQKAICRFLTPKMLKKCRKIVNFMLNERISDFIKLKIIHKKQFAKSRYFVLFWQDAAFLILFRQLSKNRKSIKINSFFGEIRGIFRKIM